MAEKTKGYNNSSNNTTTTVFCRMPTVQCSARNARLSVRLPKSACSKITSGQSIAAVDGWFNHFRQMAAVCPSVRAYWRHLANTIELVHSSAHLSPQPKRQIDRFCKFLHSSRQKILILYNGRPYPPELPLPMRDLVPHPTHDSLGLYEPKTQTAPRSAQPFLHRRPQSAPILYNGSPISP